MKKTILFILLFCSLLSGFAQSGSAFGVKGGLSLGTQKWNSLNQGVLFAWHGDAYIESLTENNAFSLIGQLGYHVRGSARRNQRIFNSTGSNFTQINQSFEFNNISLMVGAKQKKDFRANSKLYYLIGLRGEYTLSTNLDEYEDFCPGFYPLETFTRKYNFGLTAGGGFEFMFSKLFGGFIEFAVLPDITYQYDQPAINNVPSCFNVGQSINIGERRIRNVAFEISLGIRLLRIVEYVD